MGTYVFSAYDPGDVIGTPFPGNTIMIDPTWDVDVNALTFTITDDENIFDGDTGAQEVGSDTNVWLVVTDAYGNFVTQGQPYLEGYIAFTAPDGHTIYGYQIEIAGQIVGHITGEELQPGVSYMVTQYSEVEPNPDATYDMFANFSYDPDTANTIQGGDYADDLRGGALNDTISAGAGNDSVSGGTGDDVLDGGAGNDTIDGGAGNDTITGGTGNDVLTGGDGNDTFVYNVGDGSDIITDFNTGNTGTLSDGDSTNNDFIDLSGFYDNLQELYADQADDGILNQSNDGVGGVDYSNNLQFGTGSLTFTGASADSTFFTTENTGVICYLKGTRILTDRGEAAIENLRIGDRVMTRDHGAQPIRWIGVSRVLATPKLAPILIRAGALGAALPKRDLYVSPQHRMLIKSKIARRMTGNSEVLIPARKLTGLPGIDVNDAHVELCYFHLLCDRHEIIMADGAPSETLLPGPEAQKAMSAQAWSELKAIFHDIEDVLRHVSPARPILSHKRQKTLLRRHHRNNVALLSL